MHGGTIHFVARGLIQNDHSCRGQFHAEWVWPREMIMRCCDVDDFGFNSSTSVAPCEKRLQK